MKPTVENRLGFDNKLIKNRGSRRIAKRCDTVADQCLEGSRFAVWQFYRIAAGGSRKLPSVILFPSASVPQVIDSCAAYRTAQRWDVLGSRLLPTYRAATLQSGSPPGIGYAQPRVFIGKIRTKRTTGFSLIEMLVVVTIIAAIAALITTAVMSALQQQNARVCLNNMLTIEAAKDEYIRDHPGATSIDPNAFAQYFRFGIPRCPDNSSQPYQNLYSLTQQVFCKAHPENQQKLSAAPSPQ